jgi:ribonuclease BN (tRNA processing enzyme)
MATELILLGTAGAPMPVAGRGGICSALVVDERVLLVDCGRGAPSAYADAGLPFARLEAVFLTHLHADHVGDLAGMLIYPWGGRLGVTGPLPPVRVYGPPAPAMVPAGDADFRRETTIHPADPVPGTADLVASLVAAFAYHLNVMPLDARMPDPGQLVRAFDIPLPERTAGVPGSMPVPVFDDGIIRVTATRVPHGHAHPALAYRFDTPDGSVVFSGDTTVNDALVALAQGADILVHQVADLEYLRQQGFAGPALARMAALHTDVRQVGAVAQRAGVGELILSHYLPAEPEAIAEADWERRAGQGFSGTTTAGRDGLRRTLAR